MKIKIRETPKYCSLTKDKFKNRIDLSAKGSFEIKTDKTESVIID